MAFNILVVDDSETMRVVIKRTLGMTGVDVGELLEAGNGHEALKVLREDWVDIVLSDINMPEMGGLELLQAMNEDDVLKEIPVIFISTEASHTRMEEAEKLGVAGYIKKPFQPETIREIMLEVLSNAYASRIGEMSQDGSIEEDDMDF